MIILIPDFILLPFAPKIENIYLGPYGRIQYPPEIRIQYPPIIPHPPTLAEMNSRNRADMESRAEMDSAPAGGK